MKNFWIFTVILLLASNHLYSKTNTFDTEFLTINSSPMITSMGAAGVAMPVNDVTSLMYNPAHLAFNVQNNNFLLSSNQSNLSRYINSGNNLGFNLGYRFDSLINIPLTVGISYVNRSNNYGNNLINENSEFYESYNEYNSSKEFSIGASYQYYALFSVGMTYKSINTEREIYIVTPNKYNDNVNAFDFGVLAKIPIVEKYNLFGNYYADFDFSVGMAILNIGDEMALNEKKPLPRNSSLGYSFSLEAGYTTKYFSIKFLNIDWSAATVTNLVSRKGNEIRYNGMFGDMNIYDNLIAMNNSENVKSNHGMRFSFLETLTFSFGNGFINGSNQNTSGAGISSRGLAKILYYLTDEVLFKHCYKYVDLNFVIANMNNSNNNNSLESYHGFNLLIKI